MSHRKKGTNLSWLGLADMFLFFFLFFLAAYIMASDDLNSAQDLKKKDAHQLYQKIRELELANKTCEESVLIQKKKNTELSGKLSLLQQENISIKDIKLNQDENIRNLTDNIKRLEQENSQLKTIIKPGQNIGDTFGRIISEALTILNDLKKKMEGRNFPVKIYRYPDSLFFDMQIFFKFGHNKIMNAEDREAIVIIGKQFRYILDQQQTFVCNNTTITCQLNQIMKVVIEGHTDDKKKDEMANFHYSSNRALEVLQILIKECGMLPPKYKLSIAGYAEFGRQPIVDELERKNNDIYRDRMRRVTISIVPNYEGVPDELKECLSKNDVVETK